MSYLSNKLSKAPMLWLSSMKIKQLTYRELNARANQLARYLEQIRCRT